jgi:hypothetical protein
MTQQPDTATAQPTSTVTKHIKIYSDNPIHDCIDRIIDAVAVFDEGDDYSSIAAAQELLDATESLYSLAAIRRYDAAAKTREGVYTNRTK